MGGSTRAGIVGKRKEQVATEMSSDFGNQVFPACLRISRDSAGAAIGQRSR